jgi:hypothetical protein
MTLPDNSNADRHVQYYSDYTEGSDRNEIIIFENNVMENVQSSIYAMFDVYIQPNTQIFLTNNTFRNISGLYGGVYIYNAGEVQLSNNRFYSSTDFGFGLMSFEEVWGDVTINGLTIENVISTGSSAEYFIYFYLHDNHNLSITGLSVTDSEVNQQPLVYIRDSVNVFTLQNSSLSSIKVGPSTSIFTITSAHSVSISSITFSSISSSTSDSAADSIISLALSPAASSTIEAIQVTSTSVGLLSFTSLQSSAVSSLALRDILFKN